ncbi:MAG: efflux RND transporter permease subunit [Deltaproteobacteria bacterium]|nr:efflux RND transporter permease subunit [Deltaproteobacteria bacterium]
MSSGPGMNLARILARRPSLVWLVALVLAGLGARAIVRLPSGIYPEMQFPRVVVVARHGTDPPELFEPQITRPLEQALAVVPGVRYLRARTIRGAVELSVQLAPGVDPLRAQQQCQAAVDQVALPAGTELEVERVLPTAIPVITFNVTGPGKGRGLADPRDLRDLADRVLRPALVRVPGVGAVEVQGGRVREIEIILKPGPLAAMGLTPSMLADRLARHDVRLGVGRVVDAHQTLPVIVDASPGDLAGLAALPIADGPTGPVPLSTVADVVEGAADPTVIVSAPQGEAVVIAVARAPGASTVDVAAGARDAIAAVIALGGVPAGLRVEPVYDEAALVTASMASVRDAILVGVALALIVIGLFLRDLRAGLIAAVPVPLALLATFAIMDWAGLTLNLMSLGGLAVSIGLVVDDAIVITEGIVRRLEDGHPPAEAAELGTRDLLAALIGTTLTTVLVFVPLGLVEGLTGTFLGALAATLSTAVLLSLVYAVALAPLLAARVLRARQKSAQASSRGVALYAGALRWLVRHAWLSLVAVALLVTGGVFAADRVATGFLPALDEGALVVDFFLPPGTSLEETDRIARRIDLVLMSTPEVVTFTRRTGSEMGPATATQQNRGDIMVRLVPRAQRGEILAVIDGLRERLEHEVPEARIEFVQVLQDVLADLAGNPAPIEVRLLGDDPRALADLARTLGPAITAVPDLVDVFDGLEGDVPVARATVARLAASRIGLEPETIAGDLEVAVAGRVVAQLQRPGRSLDVRARFADRTRFDLTALVAAPIAYGPASALIGDYVRFDMPPSPSVLRREGLRPAVVMTAAVLGGDLGAAEDAVAAVIARTHIPPGIQVEQAGQAASARAARTDLLVVAGIGAVLVLIVLLVQLGSLNLAMVVLLGAPLAVVGALAVLVATDLPLDLSSLTGCILLVGLVVKNGILLLEHARDQLASGRPIGEALVEAAERRLRPILMTTAATLAGLAPLAAGVGSGAELQRPLAIAVIGGLVLSTAVTLFVLPGLAALVVRRGARG